MSILTDVVIIGAGASGLFCALEAGKRKGSVMVLDHSGRIGNKIRISGGGHCNFTNRNISHENCFSAGNPDFCKSALSRFTPHDIIRMIESYGVNYFEKDDGQLFCSGSSGEIIHMLSTECRKHDVKIVLDCRIMDISNNEGKFIIRTNKDIIMADSLVAATGGLSYPRLGATDIGYKIARQFDLKVTQLKPALVPLLFTKSDLRHLGKLSGLSVKAKVGCNGRDFQGMILFTHQGVSGPATLQISSIWKTGDAININLFSDEDVYG